jgi:hypothetical protein
MLVLYMLNDFERVSFVLIFSGVTFVFSLHMRCISTVRYSCFKYFWILSLSVIVIIIINLLMLLLHKRPFLFYVEIVMYYCEFENDSKCGAYWLFHDITLITTG